MTQGGEDGRLVREANEGPGPGAACVDLPAGACTPMSWERSREHGHRAASMPISVQALHAARTGPTIVTTGTASGKSMCFNLPTLRRPAASSATARAMYLYPTKALAQDQARALAAFGLTKRVRPAIYDGDTPSEARSADRSRANVVLSNPDMLHMGILPNHAAWAELFANLAVVVSTRRTCTAASSAPTWATCSDACAGSPRPTAPSRLPDDLGDDREPGRAGRAADGSRGLRLIDEDGSPAPQRRIAMWNPPLEDEAIGARRSALGEAAELLARLVQRRRAARSAS